MLDRFKPTKPARFVIVAMVILLAAIDVLGTPLAIVALKSAQGNFTHFQQAVIETRQEDCDAAEKIRKRGREKITREEKELPKTLALLHITNPQELAQARVLAKQQYAEGRAQLAAVDCVAYANKDKTK